MKNQYQALYSDYKWLVPPRFNIAEACCTRWNLVNTEQRRVAVFAEDSDGRTTIWTYAQIGESANKLANGLRRMGVQRGDRIALLLDQRGEAIVAHIACYLLGAIVVPISNKLGADGIEYRLKDSEVRVAIIDNGLSINLLPIYSRCPMLRQVIGIDIDYDYVIPWRTLLARQDNQFMPVDSSSYDPALILYSSGTTSDPKGALLSHGSLIGQLPGFVASQNWFPEPKETVWTSSDWALLEGLLNGVLPTLYFGCPIVAIRGNIEAQRALAILVRYKVTCLSTTPYFLRRLYQAYPENIHRQNLVLRSIVSSSTPLPSQLFEWSQQVLEITPNEVFGMVEANHILGNSYQLWAAKPGSIGRPYPGHQVALLDNKGKPVKTGVIGEISIHRRDIHQHQDPTVFLGYWRSEEGTLSHFQNEWFRSGEFAYMDVDGDYWYVGRADDTLKINKEIFPIHLIENELQTLSGVQCITLSHHNTNKNVLIIYLVTTPNIRPPHVERLLSQITKMMEQKLGDSKLKLDIQIVPEIPRTLSGKIRRHIVRTNNLEHFVTLPTKTRARQ